MKTSNLFESHFIGELKLNNRIVMAPLTRCRADENRAPHALNAKYYAQRASAGLIISEASQISPQGVGYLGTPGIHSAEQVSGWKLVTKAVHDAGGKIFLQLWHVGRISHPLLQPNGELPVSASAVTPQGSAYTLEGLKPFVTPRALELKEIPEVVKQYKTAAQNAKSAGFDGVEVHAANGYLIDQFLRDGSNKRSDAYGGSKENRARLLFEICEAVKEVWGAKRVGVRLSPEGGFNDMRDSNPKDLFGYVVKELNRFDLAYLHIREPAEDDLAKGGNFTPLSYFRSLFKGTLMVNGQYDAAKAKAVLSEGDADLIAFGRLFISNPDLPKRLETGSKLTPPDMSTFYMGGEKGYVDYPTL